MGRFKSRRVPPGSALFHAHAHLSRRAAAGGPPPHEITVPVYDFLVLVDVLPPELLERVEERLAAWPGRCDHPAHAAGRAGHGCGCDATPACLCLLLLLLVVLCAARWLVGCRPLATIKTEQSNGNARQGKARTALLLHLRIHSIRLSHGSNDER